MEDSCQINLNLSDRIVPTDPEFAKGLASFLACCNAKECCKKYKKGKRCKKCPDR